MFDYHIHSSAVRRCDTPQEFLQKAQEGGITGGAVISSHPRGYVVEDCDQRWEVLLEKLLAFTAETPNFRPIFWIDPTDPDIEDQIRRAAELNISGFKIICNHFYPEDILSPLAMIAETGLPVNFHCGILYSTKPAAKYNMPHQFEVLMNVKNLRFSLAHAGWPWTDEYNSIIGEFFWGQNNVDVYADLTPGTPRIYRRDVLRRLYLCGFTKLKDHILWGPDKYINDYDYKFAADLIRDDREILEEIAADAPKYRIRPFGAGDAPLLWQLLSEDNMTRFFTRD